MEKNLIKLLPYTKPYKTNIVLNIVYNVLYALFSTLSMITLFPLLEVLFKKSDAVIKAPVFTGIENIGKYGKEWLFYNISHLNETHGPQSALLLAVVLVIITFLFKNLFNFLASYHITHLKNGVLRDLRKTMYDKIIELDMMARMLGDVNEVQNSFFSILELIVKEPLTILFTIIAMLNISVNLTLFVFLFIPISGFVIS
ncbi:MAG: hypothetical protein RIT22_2015, partial [Bacteroidota bacterium]